MMIRKPHALLLALALAGANRQALTSSAPYRRASSPAPHPPSVGTRVILRLAEPPVSAVAPPAAPGRPRVPASAAEVRREQAYCRALKTRQDALSRRLAAQGVRVIARYQVAFNGLCVEAPESLLPRLAHLPGVVSASRVLTVHRTNTN